MALSAKARRLVSDAVDQLFDRAAVRLLGPRFVAKRIFITYAPRMTLPALYAGSAAEELARPDEGVAESLAKITKGYLDAQRAQAKASVTAAVERFLMDHRSDAKTVLGGQLADTWRTISSGVRRIVETEATTARNVGALEGISRVNAASGIDDPMVYFVVVRDDSLCAECRRLHLLEDGATPRCWRMSEVSHAYHKKGGDHPSVGGEHPNCRCTIATLLPGYGFNDSGMVTFIANGHDELARQRS